MDVRTPEASGHSSPAVCVGREYAELKIRREKHEVYSRKF